MQHMYCEEKPKERLIGRLRASVSEWARRKGDASVAVGNDSWKSVCFGVERPSFRPSFRRTAAVESSESHGRPTLSIYSFANAICRRRLFESITPSELLRSADVGACNPRRPAAAWLDAQCTRNDGGARRNERLDESSSRVKIDTLQLAAVYSWMFTFRRHSLGRQSLIYAVVTPPR